MLTIRQAQMDVLRDVRNSDCAERLATLLMDDFPSDARRLNRSGVDCVVRLGMERSRVHERATERDMYLYLTMMFMLGSGFDSDPQLPWARKMLATGAPLESLHRRSLRHLDQVAGEDNQHLVRALVRVQAIPLTDIPDPDATDFESRTTELLNLIYPTKFAVQGTAATRATIRHAGTLVGRYQISGCATLLAVYAFLLGFGFDRDPVHPWIREILERSGLSSLERATALHQAGREFARRALE